MVVHLTLHKPTTTNSLMHMISLIRRVSISISSSISTPSSPFSLSRISSTKLFMENKLEPNNISGSKRLLALAQQLRMYTPPPIDDQENDDEKEKRIEETEGKVVSQVGFAESATLVGSLEDQGKREVAERFKPKRAAVLICLYEGDCGELRVILTKRSSKLSTHSGEVALPGGKAEETDRSDAETATREAEEEIGLNQSLVNIVTCLEPFLSKHLLRVIPVIGILSARKQFNPTPNADEVESIFDAPLEMFLKDENRRSEEREWQGDKYLIHYFDYEIDSKKYTIWGLTAGILIRAASIVYQRPPSFLEQNPKFKLPKGVDKDSVMR